jgi:hypothetical protein
MYGMLDARIVIMTSKYLPYWTAGTIVSVQDVVIDRRNRTKAPEWYVNPDDCEAGTQSHLGNSLWRLVGTQRVYFNQDSPRDELQTMQQFYVHRDLRCIQLVQAYRSALGRVISASNVVGVMLEYLVWHDKDRDIPNKLFA